MPNQMHTLRIYYINYIYLRGLRVPSTWHVQRTHSEQDAGIEECACSSCFETARYTCLRCERLKKKKKKNLLFMCTRTSNRQKLSNTGYIISEASRLLRTKSSKTTFQENITIFKQRLRYRGYLDNLVDKLFQRSISAKECRHNKTNKKRAKTFSLLLRNIALPCLT